MSILICHYLLVRKGFHLKRNKDYFSYLGSTAGTSHKSINKSCNASTSQEERIVSNIKTNLFKKKINTFYWKKTNKLKFWKCVNYSSRRTTHHCLRFPERGKKSMPGLKVFVFYIDTQGIYLNDQIIIALGKTTKTDHYLDT